MLGFHGLSEFSLSQVSTLTHTTTAPSGGWYIYPTPRVEAFRNLRLSEKRAELRKIDNELALRAREEKRLEDKKALAAHIEAKLEAQKIEEIEALKQEINRLRMERVWLMRLIDDEEAILVLLLGAPLH